MKRSINVIYLPSDSKSICKCIIVFYRQGSYDREKSEIL